MAFRPSVCTKPRWRHSSCKAVNGKLCQINASRKRSTEACVSIWGSKGRPIFLYSSFSDRGPIAWMRSTCSSSSAASVWFPRSCAEMPRASHLLPRTDVTNRLKSSSLPASSLRSDTSGEMPCALHSRKSSAAGSPFQMMACLSWATRTSGGPPEGRPKFLHCDTSMLGPMDSKLLTSLSTTRAVAASGSRVMGMPKFSQVESASNCNISSRGWSSSTSRPRCLHTFARDGSFSSFQTSASLMRCTSSTRDTKSCSDIAKPNWEYWVCSFKAVKLSR
mmetsp:Transcript_99214/g.319959  ORF Transcript_99214/g.319959 Transcript_99214/m.319959 type:complete len:277 (-) Transcript_99214:1736-2566(-)